MTRNHPVLFPLFALLWTAALFSVSPVRGAVPIETCLSEEGKTCFAVPLTLPAPDRAEGTDMLIAVDLSAGQLSRQVREEARNAVSALIAGLPRGSRVQVFVLSNEMTPIASTPGFVGATPELAAAAAADLARETPLGAMDLKKGIQSAREALNGLDGANRKSIVFIGRGVSTASFFNRHEAARLTAGLVEDRITFSAFANGAVTNNNALASLVFQTGGAIADLRIKEGAEAGACLAAASAAAVGWLENDDLAEQLGADALYPARLPPIRSDRETFLIGEGDLPSENPIPLTLEVADAAGTRSTLELSLTAAPPKEENRSLARMVREAAKDGGIALPIPGRALLREYMAALENEEEQIKKHGDETAEKGEDAPPAPPARPAEPPRTEKTPKAW